MLEMTCHEIDLLLADTRIGRLCMAAADGRPYIVPLPFCWTDGALYLRLAMTGRKGQVLQENDRVCFEIDYYTDMLDDYSSVLIEGRLVPVLDVEEKARVRHLNNLKYNRLRQGFRPGHGRSTPLYALPLCKILVDQLSGRKKAPAAGTCGTPSFRTALPRTIPA
jgi:nitroimidazol reductase NimA-like FMN-containing flavoprotein (pyridoxamine 5'-phosphate oxidase superfamily)